MPSRPKIIIVDNHPLFREGIKLLIEKEEMGEIIAEAENGQAFLSLLKTHNPDLVLMDIEMPVMNGLEATRLGLEITPGLKILMFSMYYDQEYDNEMINSGAMGFVMKTSGKQELEKAIKSLIHGEKYFPIKKIDPSFNIKSNTK